MKQTQPRLVGGEIDAGAHVGGHYHRILDDTGGGFSVNLGNFEIVPVKVQGMRSSVRLWNVRR
ncbi:MAG TPA: hypothetical protein VJ732_00210 [Bryobacteraceae bacterium]|nr:hypothetical protein [Bryobacteraceae bacterium]